MTGVRLPKSFERLAEDFEKRETLFRKKVGRKALAALPRRTERHGDLANAYYYLSRLAFRAGRFDRAAHYFTLEEEHTWRHAEDADLEDWERDSARSSLDEAGWVTGDWGRYERYVRQNTGGFAESASITAHTNVYRRWAILGRRVGEDRVPPLETAVAYAYGQAEEFSRPEVLEFTRSIWADDDLAVACFWSGDYAGCVAAASRFLAAAADWKDVSPKPRNVDFGSLGPPSDLMRTLTILAGEDEEAIRSGAAVEVLVKYLVARRGEPSGYLFGHVLLLLKAVAWADPRHELVEGFLGVFPHLGHLVAPRG